MMKLRTAATGVLLSAVLGIAACAPRVAPAPVVTIPKFPEFMFPDVPADLAGLPAIASHERAWAFLQAGDLRSAERSFSTLLKRTPSFYPAEAGLGYLELAQRRYRDALSRFDRALERSSVYLPALVGRGETLLALDRSADALQTFEAALAVQPALPEVQRRVEVLRFRGMQEHVARARQASEAGRDFEARQAYEQAIAASPDSAFLYRELAGVEHRQGNLARALEHARKAADLDPEDVRALTLIGTVHESRGELEAALEAYTRAQDIDPQPGIESRIERLTSRIALAALPVEYRAIADSPRMTRGELAALLGIRLEPLLEGSQRRPTVLITDTRGHWAVGWIVTVARAGVMDVFPNHTFQPNAPVRRGDLGHAVSRVLNLIAARDPALGRNWQNARQRFTDLGPAHLSYPAASLAVAAGVLPLLEGDTFQLTRPVSGAEAIAAVERLEVLAGRAAWASRP
jgi:tetratricopeptide (TPR) repeat protein